jgi:hypothetical protein
MWNGGGMTNLGFILGCSILAFGIWLSAFYLNRGLWMLGNAIIAALKKEK